MQSIQWKTCSAENLQHDPPGSCTPPCADIQSMAVQLSWQLRAVRDGGHVVSTEHLAELGFNTAAEPKQPKARSRSARQPKPAQKPKAGGAPTLCIRNFL